MDKFIIVISLVLPLLLAVPGGPLTLPNDYPNYYAASKLIRSGNFSSVYDQRTIKDIESRIAPERMKEGGLPFLVPPVLALGFFPLSFFSYQISLWIWTIFSITLIVVSYLVLTSLLALSKRTRLWAAAVTGSLGPAVISIALAQLSAVLLLGMVCLIYGYKQKRWIIAAIGQSLLWLKPHLVIPLICFEAGAKRYGLCIMSCIVAFFGLLVSSCLGGFSILPNYIHLLIAHNQISGSNLGLQIEPTLRGQLLKLFLNFDHITVIAIIGYLTLLGFAWYAGKLAKEKGLEINLLFCTIVPLSLCLALHAHSYDLLLLCPGAFLLMTPKLSRRLNYARLFLIAGSTAIFILPTYLLIHYLYILRGGVIDPFFLDNFDFCHWVTDNFIKASL